MKKVVPLLFVDICLVLLRGCKKEELKLDILKHN